MASEHGDISGSRKRFILGIILTVGFLVTPISASSDSIDAFMGDVITLQGVSYASNTVYLFITGPKLPVNGVPLTVPIYDSSQVAEKGAFTAVDVGNDQRWSYVWDTYRLHDRIDYGTYRIYVVPEPVDLSQLAGHQYDTIDIYLKRDPVDSHISFPGGTSYTLHLDDSVPTTTKSITPEVTIPTQSLTPVVSDTISSPLSTAPPIPTQKSGSSNRLLLIAVGSLICGLMIFKRHML